MNSVQRILNQKLIDLQSKNPRLSHRFFAQKIGISSGALSEILKGKRKVSPKLAAKMADRLHLDPKTKAALLGLEHNSDFESEAEVDYLQLSDDQFHLISDWPHFAILNLVKSDDCQHRVDWFAERLNLPVRTVQDAVDRLLRLGMLIYQKRKYQRTKAHFKTSDGILNLSIQKSHLEDLEMIREHLNYLEIHERDMTSITFLLDPVKMPEFKKWLRKAQDQFCQKFETTKSTTPYRLTLALYPLKRNKK